MSKVLITQSNYIPWKGYFDAIAMVDTFIVYDDMQYTKRDWRNRNKIKTPSGTAWLSIPIAVKGKYLQKINEAEVSDPNWGQNHWKTIKQFYKNAPCFHKYEQIFEDIYLSSSLTNLSKINIKFIHAINKILNISTEIIPSSTFQLVSGKTERLVELCLQVGGTLYFSGPSAQDYLDINLFTEAGISVSFIDYSGYPNYQQLYGEFAHDVTILDLLFNHGTQSYEYMKHILQP